MNLKLDAKKIGEKLLFLRGKTPREEVAREIGVSVSAMSMYENLSLIHI